jgi:hypothetical protein
MLNKIQDFFINKMLGRLLVRAGVSAAAFLASGQLGASVNVDPSELTALLVAGANALVTLLKKRKSEVPAEAPAQ